LLVLCFAYACFPSVSDNETVQPTEVELSSAPSFERNGFCKGLEKTIGIKYLLKENSMKVYLKCFATLAEGDVCDFRESTQNQITEGETVNAFVERLGFPKKDIKMIFVNNKLAGFDTVLKDGDQVALSPPVGGM
jgi:molybdopterin converting factor small subunit